MTVVQAAGGLVVRGGRVLLVHRPRHDDWSLPKGKLEPGESWEQCALREVEEETGLRCVVGGEAGRTRYDVEQGLKEVRYFRMTGDGEPRAQNEVDEVRWASAAVAEQLLTYRYDCELVRSLLR